MTVIQLQPYLELNEWIEATDGMVASIDPKEWSDGEMNWLMAIAHLQTLTQSIREALPSTTHKQQWIELLHAFIETAQEQIFYSAISEDTTRQECLLAWHLSVGVAIAHRLYPALSMDWCTEIEMEDFGREGN